MGDCCLVLDQGGHASRAIVLDGGGRQLAAAFAPITTQRSADGSRVEHDPAELIGSLRSAMAEAAAQVLQEGHRIRAAGLATQRSSIACWSRASGAALSPVISWQDRRHARWLRSLAAREAWVREHTGLVLSPHYGASKMRWCLEELPAVRDAAAAGDLAMGPLASFIVASLTTEGGFFADPANASRTQLWDPRTGDWSAELLALFGVPREALPQAVGSRHAFGTLEVAGEAVPLVVVTGDQSAVPFAFGPLDPATAYTNAGTGAFIQRAIRGRMPDAPRLLASVVWSDADAVDYVLEGTVNGAGSALAWLAAEEGRSVAWLLEAAGAAHDEPPLFLNGVSGLGAPWWVSDFPSRFVGSGESGGRALAVLESIVFLLMVNLDELRPHGPVLRRLVLTGGFAANTLFCQRLADLSGLAVWRSDEPEATARGLGWLVSAAKEAWPAAGTSFGPQPAVALERRFVRWREAMQEALHA